MGVYFNKRLQKWHARRFSQGKNNHIGYFDTFEEAVANYKDWEPSPFNEDAYVPKKTLNPYAGWTQDTFKEVSRAQITELTKKHGPKMHSPKVLAEV